MAESIAEEQRRASDLPRATIAIVALLVAAAVGQIALDPEILDAEGVRTPVDLLERFFVPLIAPSWAAAPLALPARLLLHESAVHALLAVVGVSLGGALWERRVGAIPTVLVALAGGAAGLALWDIGAAGTTVPWLGATGASMALFGALLMDLARRGGASSLFGPLVAPMLLHGAIDALVLTDYSALHAAGFVVGALLGRWLTGPQEP